MAESRADNVEVDEASHKEEKYVHNVYNEIASHFSKTRYKPWPIVEKFLLGQDDYNIGLDVGCGNGKYLSVNQKVFIIGSDRSAGLIQCASNISSSYNIAIADGLHLPHQDDTFDFALSIAVIHHFATEERRIEAIRHILLKLKKGGKLLVYCWALEQENSRRGYKEGDDQDVFVPWKLQKSHKKNSKEEQEQTNSNTLNDEETKLRYYHLYKKGELANNAMKTGNCVILDQGYERDNWWIIVSKI